MQRFPQLKRILPLLVMAMALTACSEKEIILPGERISVVDSGANDALEVNALAAAEGAGLPAPVANNRFATPGVDAGHGGGHFKAEFPLSRVFSRNVGRAADDGTDMAQPVVNENAVFTITPGGLVVASSTERGERIWDVDIDPSTDKTQVSISGGMALEGDDLIVHAGKRRLVSLNAGTGEENWSIELPHFIVGGPTVAGGFVIVSDVTGRIYALAQSNGEELWNRIGAQGKTRITGAAYPAIANNSVIIAGGDGELISLSLADGSFQWGDSLVPVRVITALDTIGDIVAHPVNDGTRVIAVTQTGVMVAYNARTGRVLWERSIRSLTMPWLAGETLYVTTTNNELLALRVSDGEVRWKTDLPGRYEMNEPVREGAYRHTGVVALSGKVVLASRRGEMLVLDAETGAIEKRLSAGGAVTTALSVAGGKIFVLDRGGRLRAWQ